MMTLVDGGSNLTLEEVARDIQLNRQTLPVSGSVLSAAEAVRRANARLALGCAIGCLLIFGMIAMVKLTANAYEWDNLSAPMLALVALTPLGLGIAYLIGQNRVYVGLPAHYLGVAPTGTRVVADAAGLAMGGAATPWIDLRLERLEIVTAVGGEGAPIYRVARASGLGPAGPWALDAMVLDNGQALLDEVYSHLMAKPRGA